MRKKKIDEDSQFRKSRKAKSDPFINFLKEGFSDTLGISKDEISDERLIKILKTGKEVESNEVIKSFQTRCIKITNRTKTNKKEEYIEICGKFKDGSRVLEAKGLFFRLDLCQKHLDEFEVKEKEGEDFEKTDFKCPECDGPIFRHYHIRRGIYPEYSWFWCPNYHELSCGNCKFGTDSHGDFCGAFFCLHNSGWEPINKDD